MFIAIDKCNTENGCLKVLTSEMVSSYIAPDQITLKSMKVQKFHANVGDSNFFSRS